MRTKQTPLPYCFHGGGRWKRFGVLQEKMFCVQDVVGAPDRIRTCDPQIRSLVLDFVPEMSGSPDMIRLDRSPAIGFAMVMAHTQCKPFGLRVAGQSNLNQAAWRVGLKADRGLSGSRARTATKEVSGHQLDALLRDPGGLDRLAVELGQCDPNAWRYQRAANENDPPDEGLWRWLLRHCRRSRTVTTPP
jgi:hypothetical protein